MGAALREEENSVQQDQTVSEMAEEVLRRQAKALSQRSGRSLQQVSVDMTHIA
jgi:hypothetical protein